MSDSPKHTDEGTATTGRQKVMLVPTRRRKPRNVLTRMHSYEGGSLGMLRHYVEWHIRVKVWTRNYKHVRGICIGYIVAFDKHWNLAMIDVDETYTNPVPAPEKPKKKRIRKKKLKSVETTEDTVLTVEREDVSKQQESDPSSRVVDHTFTQTEHLHISACSSSSVEKSDCTNKHGISKNVEIPPSDNSGIVRSDLQAVAKSESDNNVMPGKSQYTVLTNRLNKLVMNYNSGSEPVDDAGYHPVLTRHVNQLFLRGDNVVLVSVYS